MKSSDFTYLDRDSYEIFVYKWQPETEPKAVVQILHGLAEHAKRYVRVAEVLCKEGYICFADDHHGHGRTAGDLTEATLKGNAGVLGPNGWRGVVNAVHELSKIIQIEQPKLPLFLLGHSWGAFLAQDYIQEWGNELKGCILSGTGGEMGDFDVEARKLLYKGEIKKIGPTEPSQKLHDMIFKSNNQEWKNDEGATGFEWLSRDKSEVQKYVDDPWCGFVSPANLWLEFLNGFEKMYDSENEKKVPKDLPVYFMSGSLDPIGNKTEWIQSIMNRYQDYGIKDIAYKFYQDARHEIFNEINREEVFRDVISWLNSHL